MIKILICGLCGHMGRELETVVLNKKDSFTLVGGVDAFCCEKMSVPCVKDFSEVIEEADVIIDFSHHSLTPSLLCFAKEKKIPAVIATTGHTEKEIEEIYETATQIPIFFSANMSIGIALLADLAKKAALAFPDAEIEIIEKHHTRKIDAPSGTANMLFSEIKQVRPDAYAVMGRSGMSKREKNEIGIHSLRMGNVVGEHEVIISTNSQTITMKHEAHSRALFADGALSAAEFLYKKPAGLYTMKDLLAE